LQPPAIDGIFLSHKHLDHSGDINAIIEAMTGAGSVTRGTVLAPADALDGGPVILPYLRSFPEKIMVLEEGNSYPLGHLLLQVPIRHVHGVETYGFLLHADGVPCIGYVSDTRYFDRLVDAYRPARILVLNVVFHEPRTEFDHLSLPDAERIIRAIQPEKAILTHFGMSMLKNRIWEQMDAVSQRVGTAVIAAEDRMTIPIPEQHEPGAG